MSCNSVTRRDALRQTAGLAAGAALAVSADAEESGTMKKTLPMRKLGRTGAEVSIIGLGGGGTGSNPQIRGSAEDLQERARAEQIIAAAIEEGITLFDTCSGYGHSEEILGEVAKTHRKEMFLSTKCKWPVSDAGTLRRELEASLEAMKTDHVDMWQIHNIESLDQAEKIFWQDRAIEVFVKAREEGLTRFIGISSHQSEAVISDVLEQCKALGIVLDSCLFGLNYTDAAAGGHGQKVLERYAGSGVGLMAMKVFGSDRAPLLRYDGINAEKALRWVLSKPVATAVIGMHTVAEVVENARIARSFEAMSADEIAAFEQEIAGRIKPKWALGA